jgi:hypothetical protein
MPELLIDLIAHIRHRVEAFNATAPMHSRLQEHESYASGGMVQWQRLTYPAAYLELISAPPNGVAIHTTFKASASSDDEKPEPVVIRQLMTPGRTDPFVRDDSSSGGYPSLESAIERPLAAFFARL